MTTNTLINTLPLSREIQIKLASLWADVIGRIPYFENEAFNNFLRRSNASEKLRIASWLALTNGLGSSALYVEKNIAGNWTLNVGELIHFKRLNYERLIQARIVVDKVSGHIASAFKKQIREYNLIIKNNEISHVELRHAVEDERGRISYDPQNLGEHFNFMTDGKPEKIELKVLPVVIFKGHLGDGILLIDRVKTLLVKANELWNIFINQAKLSGAKFLVNGSLIESGNLSSGDSQETAILKAIASGDNVIIYQGQLNTEAPTIENIGIMTNLQEFRANLDWIINQCKEISLVPDFNGGDKGTANIQTAEVEATQESKNRHLDAWEKIKIDEWNEVVNIWRLRSGNKDKEKGKEFIKGFEPEALIDDVAQLNKQPTDNNQPMPNKGANNGSI